MIHLIQNERIDKFIMIHLIQNERINTQSVIHLIRIDSCGRLKRNTGWKEKSDG